MRKIINEREKTPDPEVLEGFKVVGSLQPVVCGG